VLVIHCPACDSPEQVRLRADPVVGSRWHAECLACGHAWAFDD
jgi:Zn ribbon nucleic-acid-binding protein